MTLPVHVVSAAFGGNNQTTTDVSLAITSAADSILIGWMLSRGIGGTLAVTLDPGGGNQATFAVGPEASVDNNLYVRSFYLVNPPSGTFTIRFTTSTSMLRLAVAAQQFSGVDQTTPLGADAATTGTTEPKTVSVVTTAADSLVIAALSSQTTTEHTSSDATERFEYVQAGIIGWGGDRDAATTGSYAISASGAAASYAMVGIELLSPAAVGGDLLPSASDAVSLAEAIAATVAIPGLTITDSAAVAEAVTALVQVLVGASDSVTVAESVAAELLTALSVTDSIGVAETVAALVEVLLSVSDAVGVAEDVTVAIVDALITAIAVSDSVVVAEVVTALVSTALVVASENIGVAEAVTVALESLVEALSVQRVATDTSLWKRGVKVVG